MRRITNDSAEDTLINERGQVVPMIGNAHSPARIKSQFPDTFGRLMDYLREYPGSADGEYYSFREYFDRHISAVLPDSEQVVREAFWRAAQCEQDILNLNNKRK